jgi:thiol-disulfide isomerase/thioredoxin
MRETQKVANAYGPKATPHVFVFDAERELRYQGRFDNSYRRELIKTEDARNAIDAVLADKPLAVDHTGVFGCSTKWKYKQQSRLDQLKKFESEPVTVEPASAADLKKLRSNPTGKLLLVNFWATWCGPCVHELPDLIDTYRMYRARDFDFVAVSANMPDEKNEVMKMLQKQHASNRSLLLASDDTDALQSAFDPGWQAGVPYTVLISPAGQILFKQQGELDILQLRRTILANMPGDYEGFRKYWAAE